MGREAVLLKHHLWGCGSKSSSVKKCTVISSVTFLKEHTKQMKKRASIMSFIAHNIVNIIIV
jgi:hypothetical protein